MPIQNEINAGSLLKNTFGYIKDPFVDTWDAIKTGFGGEQRNKPPSSFSGIPLTGPKYDPSFVPPASTSASVNQPVQVAQGVVALNAQTPIDRSGQQPSIVPEDTFKNLLRGVSDARNNLTQMDISRTRKGDEKFSVKSAPPDLTGRESSEIPGMRMDLPSSVTSIGKTPVGKMQTANLVEGTQGQIVGGVHPGVIPPTGLQTDMQGGESYLQKLNRIVTDPRFSAITGRMAQAFVPEEHPAAKLGKLGEELAVNETANEYQNLVKQGASIEILSQPKFNILSPEQKQTAVQSVLEERRAKINEDYTRALAESTRQQAKYRAEDRPLEKSKMFWDVESSKANIERIQTETGSILSADEKKAIETMNNSIQLAVANIQAKAAGQKGTDLTSADRKFNLYLATAPYLSKAKENKKQKFLAAGKVNEANMMDTMDLFKDPKTGDYLIGEIMENLDPKDQLELALKNQEFARQGDPAGTFVRQTVQRNTYQAEDGNWYLDLPNGTSVRVQ